MRDNTMSIEIEMHLREMGILPANIFDEMEQVSQSLQDHRMRMSKGFYDDPRKEAQIRGYDGNNEVPF
jgi:hypothetical protein